MDFSQQQIAELRQKYLLDKLSISDLVNFESYILDKPWLIEQLQLDDVIYQHRSALKTTSTFNKIRFPLRFRMAKSRIRLSGYITALCLIMLLISDGKVLSAGQSADSVEISSSGSKIWLVLNIGSNNLPCSVWLHKEHSLVHHLWPETHSSMDGKLRLELDERTSQQGNYKVLVTYLDQPDSSVTYSFKIEPG